MEKSFKIGDTEVAAGKQAIIDLPIAGLYTHSAITLPVHVIHGRKPGPCLFISAAIHGDELNGVEIIRRVLRKKIAKNLNGTLIAIPVVNVFGMIQHSRYLPDRRDLNRSFPGSKNGSLAARLANIFLESIVKHCTHGIDLHTGALHRSNLPQIRADLDHPETEKLAKAFGVPVLINSNVRDGSLRQVAAEHGVTMLLYEAGEALRFNELSIRAGVHGVLNVMTELGMLSAVKKSTSQAEPFIARASAWSRASHSGILQSKKSLGDWTKKDELLGVIHDPSDMFEKIKYEVRASNAGIIIGKTNLPLVNEGDALYHIASFEKGDVEDVAAEVELFQQGIYSA